MLHLVCDHMDQREMVGHVPYWPLHVAGRGGSMARLPPHGPASASNL